MSLRLLRRSLTIASAVAVTSLQLDLLATPAQAQTTTPGTTINVVQEQSLPRLTSTGGTVTKRPLNQEPEGVSLQDCLDDQRIAFPLQLAGYQAQATLEAWAGLSGVDCGVQTNRQSGTKVCWKIDDGIALEPTPRPAIAVRRILSGVVDPINPDSSAAICGKVNLTTISVQFLYFAPGQLATPTANKVLQVRADTIGPDAPAGIQVLPGNGRIRISFGGLGEGGLTQYTGVNAYCAPATRTASTSPTTSRVCSDAEAGADAGVSDAEAGADASISDAAVGDCEDVTVEGGATTKSCTNANLAVSDGGTIVPNADFNAQYQCGSLVGNTGSTILAESIAGQPLENFTEYAVAVAAIDQFANVGPLSSVFCETPEPTTDFWESYKSAGGGAGGGICSVDGAGLPVGSITVMSAVGLAALGTLRRRRRGAHGTQDANEKRGSR
jgi:MYXO-CTERM domain-containing protein